jgi:beta-glucosidase
LFPFGHGLSYTAFEYPDLAIDPADIAAGESVTVTATVRNASERAGDEVVQLYLHQRHGTASRPVRELKGFRRVTLQGGESRTVEFMLGRDELSY